ncbi:adenylate/guanylate cyclase domain-containing protein [Rhizobium leguminosarum]|uniref:adenylate/guanylate cyclase domain-containing protein n=1 Tax=Rhizobium leguminosarum TaxID=384 RepID=UPI003F95B083
MDEKYLSEMQMWVASQGLAGKGEAELLAGFCKRCNDGGLTLVQAALFADTLHPALESWGFYWDVAEGTVDTQQYPRSQATENADRWKDSPFHYMLESDISEFVLALDGSVLSQFPIITELQTLGHSGYLTMIHPLSGGDAIGEMDSLYSRWSTAKVGGFSESDMEALRRLVPVLALAFKGAALRRIAQSLVSVYLGRDPGERVLKGRIARGTVESFETVLWYSDMANYTALSENLQSSELISMLNDYSEATILSVCENGGDVLKLIGDGILAIFSGDLPHAAASALAARRALAGRLDLLNENRKGEGLATTTVYLALHTGEVFYGNIGSDERLDFTVIGPAVNEVCRIAASGTAEGGALVVSAEFRALLDRSVQREFTDAGSHLLKGVRQPKQLYVESN